MKTFAIVLGTVTLAIVLVAAGMWLGSNWERDRWDSEVTRYGAGMMAGNHGYMPRQAGRQGVPWGQDMPGDSGWQGRGMMAGGAYCDEAWIQPGDQVDSLDEAQELVVAYLDRLGYRDLHVTEIMEFEYNYYAIAAEEGSGIGAMELLVDKTSGAVGLEPGPNMMWNTKYGMHGGRGMMGACTDEEMVLSPKEAQDAAQGWLDENMAGRTADTPDSFYGYYTLHILHDGEIEGMLSVHGGSGAVWYHDWHGDFVAMDGSHD